MFLVIISDVIVEKFAPGYMDKLGLDYKNLKKINPKIIYASIKGYGSKGINTKYIKQFAIELFFIF